MEHGVALPSFLKKMNLRLSDMEQELYLLIEWPEVQSLMDKDGFSDNAHLKNDGNVAFPAYFVDKNWYDSVCYQDYLDSINK